MIVETSHPRFGTVRQVASSVRVGSEPPPQLPAPVRNEAADYILREVLGYGDEQVFEMRSSGAFGDDPLPPPS